MTSIAALLLIAFEAAAGFQDARLPVPDPGAQKEAEKLVRDVFQAEYALKSPKDRQALAAKLLQQAVQTRDDRTLRYVLLSGARDLGAEAGDLETAWSAVRVLEREYAVDGLKEKAALLKAVAAQARTPDRQKALAEHCPTVAEEALRREEFGLAAGVAAEAEGAARSAKQIALVTAAKSLLGEADAARKAWEAAQAARSTLAGKPEDPEANLALGKYLCLRKGAWEEALPHLAKGSDPSWKGAAERDLAAPAKPEARVDLGDAWFALSERAGTAGEKGALESRAKKWYELASDGLVGLAKVKVRKRLEAIGASPADAPASKEVDLLKLVNPARDQIAGTWTLEGGALRSPASVAHAHVQIPYRPPEEYDVKLEVERREGTGSLDLGLAVGVAQFLVVLDGWGDHSCGVERIDGKDSNANETTVHASMPEPGRTASIVCSVRRTSLVVTQDGTEVLRWKADYGRVSLTGVYVPRNPGTLFLGTMTSGYLVRSLKLVPVSGEGKPLR